MSHKGHVTVAAHHIRKVSQWQLVGHKPKLWCHATAGEGSLSNKNTHPICCVKKLRMAQAKLNRLGHTPPVHGFKLTSLCSYMIMSFVSTNASHKSLAADAFLTQEH